MLILLKSRYINILKVGTHLALFNEAFDDRVYIEKLATL